MNKKTHVIVGLIIVLIITTFAFMSSKQVAVNDQKYNYTGNEKPSVASIKNNSQYVEISLNEYGYTPIVVQKGIPVVFNIKVDDINKYGCTNAIEIPDFKITKQLNTGDNIVNFTPTKAGSYQYSCWMGMVNSNIKVVEDINNYK